MTHANFRKALFAAALVAGLGTVPFAQVYAQDSAAAASKGDNQTVAGKADDTWITTKVKSEFAANKSVKATDISVSTNDGVGHPDGYGRHGEGKEPRRIDRQEGEGREERRCQRPDRFGCRCRQVTASHSADAQREPQGSSLVAGFGLLSGATCHRTYFDRCSCRSRRLRGPARAYAHRHPGRA